MTSMESEIRGPLSGQIALITGCGRVNGMGHGLARAFAEAGADLVIGDVVMRGARNREEPASDDDLVGWRGLESLAEEIEHMGRRVVPVLGDISVPDDAQHLVDESLAAFGRVDILINNAAAPYGADRNNLWDVPVQDFDRVMAVNVRGTFLMSGAVVRHMLDRGGGGRIINMSSMGGKIGVRKRSAYGASKAAIISLTQCLALEVARSGITVNAICPGSTETTRFMSSRSVGQLREIAGEIPVGRMGRAEDVSRIAVFLALPESDFITGQAINVSGGAYMA